MEGALGVGQLFFVLPRKKHISRLNMLPSDVTRVVTGVVIAMVRFPALPPWMYVNSGQNSLLVWPSASSLSVRLLQTHLSQVER